MRGNKDNKEEIFDTNNRKNYQYDHEGYCLWLNLYIPDMCRSIKIILVKWLLEAGSVFLILILAVCECRPLVSG